CQVSCECSVPSKAYLLWMHARGAANPKNCNGLDTPTSNRAAMGGARPAPCSAPATAANATHTEARFMGSGTVGLSFVAATPGTGLARRRFPWGIAGRFATPLGRGFEAFRSGLAGGAAR